MDTTRINELLQKTVEWNKEAGFTKFDKDLEVKMLMEEVGELYIAYAKNKKLEIVDALCDIMFVATGTYYKSWDKVPNMFHIIDMSHDPIENFCMSISTELGMFIGRRGDENEYIYAIKSIIIISYSILVHLHGQEKADACYAEVVRSNYSKFVDGKCKKDKNGKVEKGPNFSQPDFSKIIGQYD